MTEREDLLSCDHSQLKFEMDTQMSCKRIHIDNIKPLSFFDLKDPEQLKEAANWKRFQPSVKKDELKSEFFFTFPCKLNLPYCTDVEFFRPLIYSKTTAEVD